MDTNSIAGGIGDGQGRSAVPEGVAEAEGGPGHNTMGQNILSCLTYMLFASMHWENLFVFRMPSAFDKNTYR